MEELLRPPALDPEPEPEPEAPVLPEPEAEAGSSDGTASEARKRAAEGDRRTPAKRRRIGIGDLDEDREADQLALVLAGPAGEAVKDEPEEQVASPQLKVFYGPPGTGKTRKLLELMRDYSDHYEFVTFHPSFSYEDFIVGLRPVLFENPDGSTSSHFEMTPGVFMRLCERARRDKRNRYALFVDEINRANVGKVFGEVLTLIEPDKRGVGIRLPGCSGSFSVPPNVDLFGSMNSTDRSIALLDIALRRRFAFVEIRPDESLLPREVDGIDLSRVLRALNDRVEFFLDRDHAIGHSYFPGVESLDDLRAAFKDKIIPLLREYFFDDTGKVAAVLHTAGSPPFVRTTSVRPADLFPARGGPLPAAARGGTFGPARDVEKHSMTDADVWTADTFRGLYE
ncbi:hypothetical protein DFJ74DRAFT_602589 [Hyaloraphidium curvatum]|nr:hypothetical protein DFJ74DRAFT_602589 [Hyaloraphidium curvatum]